MNKDDFEFLKMNLVGLREQDCNHLTWPSFSYLIAKTKPAPQNHWKLGSKDSWREKIEKGEKQ